MSDEVQFEEDTYASRSSWVGQETLKGLTAFVVRMGIAQDAKQAKYILIGIILVSIAGIAFSLSSSGILHSPGTPPPAVFDKMGSILHHPQ